MGGQACRTLHQAAARCIGEARLLQAVSVRCRLLLRCASDFDLCAEVRNRANASHKLNIATWGGASARRMRQRQPPAALALLVTPAGAVTAGAASVRGSL